MNEKNIVLFERYDGVRFVLERSLSQYVEDISIYTSHWMTEVKKLIDNKNIDLLITELSKVNPEGMEISRYARRMNPDIKIIWITVLGCDVFRDQIELMGNIRCIEKPLQITEFRHDVLDALNLII